MPKFISLLFLFFLIFNTNLKGQNSNESLELKIEETLVQLTLEEKVSLCHAQSKFSTKGVPRLGIPGIWMSDGPHGVRAEINWDNWSHAGWTNDSITAFPALTCLAATFNPALSGQFGFAVGEEARYRQKDVLLGPGVNIYRTPMNGRNFEYMGEDPFLASAMVVPYIKGVQQNGVSACVKHFVLNNQEQWRDIINVEISDRALHEIYLPAFKAAVQQAGVWSIMGAYNKYKSQYCCHNDILLNKILKEEWKFDGVVISDWAATHDTKEAALYGLDIEMGTGSNGLDVHTKNAYDNYYLATPFLKRIKSGEISEAVLDEKVRRILRLIFRTSMNPDRNYGRMNNEEHLQVARKVGAEGIVLLKNEADFFPIDPEKNITIAVIGENAIRSMAIGGGSSELKPKKEISPLEGLRERYKKANIIYTMGYSSGPAEYGKAVESKLNNDSLSQKAIELAQKADVVLFIGGLNKNHNQDCEGGDRKDMALPFGQVELLKNLHKVNKNIGVILLSGNAVEMSWLEQVQGLMQAWYLGSEAGHAIADVVSGDINPSGKLPFTFPVKLTDNSAHHFGEISYPGDGINQEYLDDIFVGYRWHENKKTAPLFAFGYGMSYTEFQISNLRSMKKSYLSGDKIEISCDVRNTGGQNGSEVVQVYVGKPESEVKRALKELKAFHKVFVEKGDLVQVEIMIDADQLAYYDESTQGWKLEKGRYILYVGNASNQIAETIEVEIR